MPEGVEIGFFIHMLGVFGLGGALTAQFVSLTMMRASTTVQEVRTWGAAARLLSQYYVGPIMGAVLLLSGGYLVSEFDEEWSEGWIGISALALIAAVSIAIFWIMPRMKEIGMAAGPAPDGPVPDSVSSKLNDPVLVAVSYGNMMIPIGIMWNMVMQPEMLGAILAIIIFAGAGAGGGYALAQQKK